mgnify:CR=1 FL=1
MSLMTITALSPKAPDEVSLTLAQLARVPKAFASRTTYRLAEPFCWNPLLRRRPAG